MYLVVMNYRHRMQRKRQLNLSRLFGAIVAWHVQKHEAEIREEFYRIHLELLRHGEVPRFFPAERLEAIDGAKAADIPGLLRMRDHSNSPYDQSWVGEPALRVFDPRSARRLLRSLGRAGEVRARISRALAANSKRKRNLRAHRK